jgi:hypothetical protein
MYHRTFFASCCSAYGGSISDDDMREHRKEIIHAADRFGVPTLKLEAEARKL